MAFGGAGPLHANALGILLGSWPVILPVGPGLLCALGDLVTNFRNEFARTYIRTFDQITIDQLDGLLQELSATARSWLAEQGIAPDRQSVTFEVDVRYARQGFEIPIAIDLATVRQEGLDAIGRRFDEAHNRLYSFTLQSKHELVNIRAVAVGLTQPPTIARLAEGGPAPSEDSKTGQQQIYVDGRFHFATIYDRAKLLAGNRIQGPAIITEMDSTSVILPGHHGDVDAFGNVLIRPDGMN
jgi:N-methylhydantoinase A